MTLRDALTRERARIRALPCIERGKALAELIETLKRHEKLASQERRAAFVETQESFGSSYADLAAIFGVTRQRAYDIVQKGAK